jgi:hypothetical protein
VYSLLKNIFGRGSTIILEPSPDICRATRDKWCSGNENDVFQIKGAAR